MPLVPAGEGVAWTREIVSRLGLQKVSRIMTGGEERQESVFIGLKAIREKADWVIIHDGVRPFVTPDLIQRALGETLRARAVAAALPASETIKEISRENTVLRTVDRRQLWMVQTPQLFDYDLILKAHEEARREGFGATDDAMLVERLGIPVKVIEGSRFNFKITTPEDLVLAEALLKYGSEGRV
ncbi:MAG: 2-C-methyl-D-erythritol 4-phosphate cytidylyltransferase [Syntrophaceae bacterium]|nr:2-C-methyl-D-erythritol 4-phosphate cytidylyltransferase [Syntrophaceae bacterium]